MITRTLKLPPELDGRLQRKARDQKVTYSEAARRAMADGLGESAGGVNMLAALEAFAGSVDGPPDLSSNPVHLEDFGSAPKRP